MVTCTNGKQYKWSPVQMVPSTNGHQTNGHCTNGHCTNGQMLKMDNFIIPKYFDFFIAEKLFSHSGIELYIFFLRRNDYQLHHRKLY